MDSSRAATTMDDCGKKARTGRGRAPIRAHIAGIDRIRLRPDNH
jgi:hypothetical protein